MSHRIEQVNRLIQKNLASIIRREVELPHHSLVSVTKVITGPDLKSARILVSILPEHTAQDTLAALERSRSFLARLLAETLTMKFSPRIAFELDAQAGRAARIETILDSLS